MRDNNVQVWIKMGLLTFERADETLEKLPMLSLQKKYA